MATSIPQIETQLSTLDRGVTVHIGDTVRVHVRIIEAAKERIQVFEGTVIAKKHSGIRETITVRKISNGVGVERIFPLLAPVVQTIEIKSRHRIRRAKLYYLRDLRGKKARLVEIKDFHNTAAGEKKARRRKGKKRRAAEKADQG